jgi:hypothetical protein
MRILVIDFSHTSWLVERNNKQKILDALQQQNGLSAGKIREIIE